MPKEYFTSAQITKEYNNLSDAKKCEILYEALDYMQQYNGRSKNLCIAMAMGYQNHEGESNTYYKMEG